MSDDLTLLSTQELLALPPVQWLMQDLIPREEFVVLFGPPGEGKSFVALDWSMSISEGMAWGPHAVEQAPVVYIAAEGGRGIQQRVRAWMKAHDKQDLPAMYFLLEPLYVREEGIVEAFLEHLADIDVWPGLIVIDTLSRSFGGGEENASADMGHFVDQTTKLARGRRMACLVVHHTNATGNRERGSTALRGGATTMFRCTAAKHKETGVIVSIELKNDKQKDGAEMASIWLRPYLAHGSLLLEHIEAPERKAKEAPVSTPMRTVDMLKVLAAAPDGLTWGEWRIASGLTVATFSRRLKKLEEAVYKGTNNRYAIYPANKDVPDTAEEE